MLRSGASLSTAIAALAAFSCTPPPAMGPGVRFAIRAGDRLVDPTNEAIALATDSTVAITAFEARQLRGGAESVPAGDVEVVRLTSARSDAPAVVRVTRTAADAIELRTGHRGSAKVRIVTPDWQHDLPIVVAEPSRVQLWYGTPDLPHAEPPLSILAGTTARFHLRRLDSMGRVLGGTSERLPVLSDPPGAAALRLRPGDRDIVDARFASPGHVVLSTAGSSPIEIDVVGPDAVASIDLVMAAGGQAEPLETLEAGAPQIAVIRARRAGGARVYGLDGAMTLTSGTPETCTVEDASRWYADGVYTVEGTGPGACTLSITFGERTVDVEVTVLAAE